MNKILLITLFGFINLASAQIQKITDAQAQKLLATGKVTKTTPDGVTVEIVYSLNGDGNLVETTTKSKEDLVGEVNSIAGYFPDNIILPVVKGSNITSISAVNQENSLPEVTQFIKDNKKYISDGYILDGKSITVISTATKEPPTVSVPSGYTQEQVNLSYKSITPNPTNENIRAQGNQALAQGRGDSIKTLIENHILKYYYYKNPNVAKDVQVNVIAKTNQPTRSIKIEGLKWIKPGFKEESTIVRQVTCGGDFKDEGKAGIHDGPHGKYSVSAGGKPFKNIQVGKHKGKLEFIFNALSIPDRAVVVYGGKVMIDTGFTGSMTEIQTKAEIEGIKKHCPDISGFDNSDENKRKEAWKKCLQGKGINIASASTNGAVDSANLVKTSNGIVKKTIDLDGSQESAELYIYGPMGITLWNAKVNCY